MNFNRLVDQLERFRNILPVLVDGIDPIDLRWKPDSGAWSILEVICHLSDEEMDDFRTRLKLTLESPTASWPRIDPPKWAIERRYNEQEPSEATKRFVREREASIRWLRSIEKFDPESTHTHPKFGSMKAGELLTAWVAHDALHLRQIAKRLHELASHHGAPYGSGYAGDWVA
ncbi:MAG TPA: DinB family protein [Tepidisphaeraceae bacterium]|nr:DinB family protein [Tepidisphaeraceae bacterium]